MPTRYLKPGVRDSGRIEAVQSPDAEILYYRLLVSVDDFGRTDARPLMVKSLCFPIRLRATADKCMQWMQALESAKLLILYEVDGKPYLQLTKWDNKPRAEHSKYPDPPTDADNRMQMLPVTVTETETETGGNPPAPAGEAKPMVPPCPHEQIIELYHRTLPLFPQVVKWTPTRIAKLQARWREDKRQQSLAWWEQFFKDVAESDFLCGRARPQPGQKPFHTDLEWIITQGNFVKILEKKYSNNRGQEGPRKVAL